MWILIWTLWKIFQREEKYYCIKILPTLVLYIHYLLSTFSIILWFIILSIKCDQLNDSWQFKIGYSIMKLET